MVWDARDGTALRWLGSRRCCEDTPWSSSDDQSKRWSGPVRDRRPREALDADTEDLGLRGRRLGWTEVRGDLSEQETAGAGRESRPPDPRPLLRGSESSLSLWDSHRSAPFPQGAGTCDSVVAGSFRRRAFGATFRFVGRCEGSGNGGGEPISSESIGVAAALWEGFAPAAKGPINWGRR